MADYNIYIHSMDGEAGGSSNGTPTFNPTTPWTSEEGGSGGGETLANPNFESPTKIAQESYSMFKGGGKVMAIIGIAYAVNKISFQAVKLTDSFLSKETGDYRTSIAISNYEAAKHAIFHPASAIINRARTLQQSRLQSERAALSLELLGDSEINSYTNRGY